MAFHRKLYNRLLEWKAEKRGRTAILVQGARRIGKSTLVEDFARNEYKSYILVDFSIATPEVLSLFNNVSNLEHIFLRLQLIYGVTLYERNSAIIFDEVQMQPLARQAIKHLVKDGRYDYIETGSLISVMSNSRKILLPSEEERIDMYPMDYEEFLWAMGKENTVELLRQAFKNRIPLGNAAHRQAMRDFRLYMLVGGMPQVVATYLETNNLAKVDAEKRQILMLYSEDFSKIDASGKIRALFNAIPAQLNKNAARFFVSNNLKDKHVERIEDVLNTMIDSRTTNVAFHTNDPNVGMALTKDLDRFKMYASDTGLFVTLAFWDKTFSENDIYHKLWNDKLSANLGYIYENMIAQMLKATGKELYYHTIPTADGKKYYEVDFVIADGQNVTPVEVKSSGYTTCKSLNVFCQKYSDRIKSRYVIYTKDYKCVDGVEFVPVYMTMFI